MTGSFKDVSLAQYREWIDYHKRILGAIDANEFPYNEQVLSDLRKRHDHALKELQSLYDFYSDNLPDD